MNERVPDSSGLPLRAMVMVLLFLGVIFLLVGFQAMGSGSNDSSDDTWSKLTSSRCIRAFNSTTTAGSDGSACTVAIR